MVQRIDPELLDADRAVLRNLLQESNDVDDAATLATLQDLEDEPVVLTSRDFKDLKKLFTGSAERLFSNYVQWAREQVRQPADVVFLSHIILYFCTSVPSSIFLYLHFTRVHGIFHCLMQAWYCGPFTLMLHNHIHNNGLLKKSHAWFDNTWPVILEPLMGHTWHSYYYHHVKHHHVEGNGPGDLSSTIRYQRDEFSHFLMYLGRFMFLIWLELPMYFFRKGKVQYAIRSGSLELASYGWIVLLAKWQFEPTLWAFIIPLVLMRIGLMVGNFGQHALVDDIDPSSDFRSSITLIDVASNRHCFNDGYHTSHHLNPRRHWREHPRAFMKAKSDYASNQALVFCNIDYLMMTFRLLRKDYAYLANCLVPIGPQKAMSKQEIGDMLRTKTRRFTEEEIEEKFGTKRK